MLERVCCCVLISSLTVRLGAVVFRYFWEHAPTVTLSYAFVYPEGIERPWSHGVKPMALALGKGVDHGRRLFHVPGPITLLTGDGGIRTGSP